MDRLFLWAWFWGSRGQAALGAEGKRDRAGGEGDPATVGVCSLDLQSGGEKVSSPHPVLKCGVRLALGFPRADAAPRLGEGFGSPAAHPAWALPAAVLPAPVGEQEATAQSSARRCAPRSPRVRPEASSVVSLPQSYF